MMKSVFPVGKFGPGYHLHQIEKGEIHMEPESLIEYPENPLYLEIRFHDNDFVNPMRDALNTIYRFVYENNFGDLEELTKVAQSKKSLSREFRNLFVELDKQNRLNDLIRKTLLLFAQLSWVEFETRGLCQNSKYAKSSDYLEDKCQHYWDYLKFSIQFHDNLEFAQEDHNHEHAYLDLSTGYVGIF